MTALALQAMGQDRAALQVISQALRLAQPGGFRRLFLDEGQPMARLLSKLQSRLAAYDGYGEVDPSYIGQLLAGWTVMERLAEIETPTLVLAGRDDFQFPPEHQAILADRLPNAELALIERAGHNAPMERPAEVMAIMERFLSQTSGGNG